MSIIRSVTSSVVHEAGRLARDLPGAVGRARMEGERTVLERRHRRAIEALGARAFVLSREGQLTAAALAPELAEVEARLLAMQKVDGAGADDTGGHDVAVAFPMLGDDTTA
jgi:hypothetical protein